jgi:chemotaxis family two-component system sensor kinase Cph1
MRVDLNISGQNTINIQQFGSIIILDLNLHIIGISENALEELKIDHIDHVLDCSLESLGPTIFGKHTNKIHRLIENIKDHVIPRQIIPIKLANKRVYLKLSLHDDQIFIEWEEQFKKYTSAKKINEFSFLLDTIQPNNWDLVCHAINRILHFDHVFVVQIEETGYSHVVAEDTLDGQQYYKDMEFSKSFMPKEVFPFYSMCSYRYSPNLKNNNQKFYTNKQDFILLESQLVPVPELHQIFLSEKGVVSALFFSIHIDGNFWGLLVAHHGKEKNIDLQQRKLCTFAIQNATSKYESYLKQNLLERNEILRTAEVDLKIDLLKSKSVNCALIKHMDIIMDMVDADGFALFNQGDVCFNGICPTKAQLYEIVAFIQAHTEKSLFKDNNFRETHAKKFKDRLPFAGLMYLKVGLLNDQILIWFRQESASKVLNLQLNPLTSEQNTPRIAITESSNKDIAKSWNDIEINFVLTLNQILKESIVSKLKEKQQWNEQVVASNNELEMLTFTLSHDLKNPLSILKIGLQFLQNSKDVLNAVALQKWYSNLIASTESIEEIINNVVSLSQQKGNSLSKEPIPMAYNLQQIFNDSSLLYENKSYEVEYGKLLPIWAEKSALYQIFSNLISNAIKYSTHVTTATLYINSYFEGGQVCYLIQDNGIGIPKENLTQIFEIFKRGSNVKDIEGTGVGLSLVKRIMERLGGSIKIESEINKGTSVYLYFPIVEDFPPSMLAD